MKTKLLIICLLLFTSQVFAEKISNRTKAMLYKDSYESCINDHKGDEYYAGNKEYKLQYMAYVEKFCDCYTTLQLKKTTKKELKSIVKGNIPKSFEDKRIKTLNYCAQNF